MTPPIRVLRSISLFSSRCSTPIRRRPETLLPSRFFSPRQAVSLFVVIAIHWYFVLQPASERP
jgi:hypothetical protein